MVCIESALDTRTIKPIRDTAIRRSARSLTANPIARATLALASGSESPLWATHDPKYFTFAFCGTVLPLIRTWHGGGITELEHWLISEGFDPFESTWMLHTLYKHIIRRVLDMHRT
eukprot:COSAG02_NODE_17514_length_998_cov_1.582870_2_plen_116_part_00